MDITQSETLEEGFEGSHGPFRQTITCRMPRGRKQVTDTVSLQEGGEFLGGK